MISTGKISGWWLLIAGGLALIVVGFSSLIFPIGTYIKLVKYSGFALLVNSILLVIFSLTPAAAKETGWLLTESALNFIFGLILLFNPFMSFLAYPVLIGSWIAVLGLLKIFSGIFFRRTIKGWSAITLTGFVFIIFGVLIFRGPYGSVISITILIGIFSLITGLLYVMDALRFRNSESTVDLLI